jgi:hypothetical protein
MSLFCRIGLHRWSFASDVRNEPGLRTHTEVIWARCSREECSRYNAWSLVHRESNRPGKAPADAPVGIV